MCIATENRNEILKERNKLERQFAKETRVTKRRILHKNIMRLTEIANTPSGDIVKKFGKTFTEGFEAEGRFGIISEYHNCIHEKAEKVKDMFSHIDCFITRLDKDKKPTGRKIGIDVKGIKRNFRQGDLDDQIVWVEHRNIHGYKGWLFGDADIIAQEFTDGFYLINREDLAKLGKKRLVGAKTFIKENYNDDIPLNMIYERKGKRYPTKHNPSTISDDMIMKLSLEDVKKHCKVSTWYYE